MTRLEEAAVAALGLVVAAIILAVVATAATTPRRAPAAPPSARTTLIPPYTSSPASAGRCTLRGPLPDPVCTPGATNPRVTQATIGQTICVVGWTGTIRPPVTYTNTLKAQQMAAYGLAGDATAYEEDHLVPLELGGAPTDPANLWPEPRTNPGAAQKDALENRMHADVCAGRTTLEAAQRAFMADWYAAWQAAGRP